VNVLVISILQNFFYHPAMGSTGRGRFCSFERAIHPDYGRTTAAIIF
jgi:hypothetical protein